MKTGIASRLLSINIPKPNSLETEEILTTFVKSKCNADSVDIRKFCKKMVVFSQKIDSLDYGSEKGKPWTSVTLSQLMMWVRLHLSQRSWSDCLCPSDMFQVFGARLTCNENRTMVTELIQHESKQHCAVPNGIQLDDQTVTIGGQTKELNCSDEDLAWLTLFPWTPDQLAILEFSLKQIITGVGNAILLTSSASESCGKNVLACAISFLHGPRKALEVNVNCEFTSSNFIGEDCMDPETQDSVHHHAPMIQCFKEGGMSILKNLNSAPLPEVPRVFDFFSIEKTAMATLHENSETETSSSHPEFFTLATIRRTNDQCDFSDSLYNKVFTYHVSSIEVGNDSVTETLKSLAKIYKMSSQSEEILLNASLKSVPLNSVTNLFKSWGSLKMTMAHRDISDEDLLRLAAASVEQPGCNIFKKLTDKTPWQIIDGYLDHLMKKNQTDYIISKSVPLRFHMLRTIALSFLTGFGVVYEGPPSSGKTSLIEYFIECLQKQPEYNYVKCHKINCNKNTELDDIHGKPNTTGKFNLGPLSHAAKYGHVVLFDEGDLLLKRYQESIMIYTKSNGGKVSVPGSNEVILVHKNFRIFFAINGKHCGSCGREVLGSAIALNTLKYDVPEFNQQELVEIIHRLVKISHENANEIAALFLRVTALKFGIGTLREIKRAIVRSDKTTNSIKSHLAYILKGKAKNEKQADCLNGLLAPLAGKAARNDQTTHHLERIQQSEGSLPGLDCSIKNALSSVANMTPAVERLHQAVVNHEPALVVGPTSYKKLLRDFVFRTDAEKTDVFEVTGSATDTVQYMIGGYTLMTYEQTVHLFLSRIRCLLSIVDSKAKKISLYVVDELQHQVDKMMKASASDSKSKCDKPGEEQIASVLEKNDQKVPKFKPISNAFVEDELSGYESYELSESDNDALDPLEEDNDKTEGSTPVTKPLHKVISNCTQLRSLLDRFHEVIATRDKNATELYLVDELEILVSKLECSEKDYISQSRPLVIWKNGPFLQAMIASLTAKTLFVIKNADKFPAKVERFNCLFEHNANFIPFENTENMRSMFVSPNLQVVLVAETLNQFSSALLSRFSVIKTTMLSEAELVKMMTNILSSSDFAPESCQKICSSFLKDSIQGQPHTSRSAVQFIKAVKVLAENKPLAIAAGLAYIMVVKLPPIDLEKVARMFGVQKEDISFPLLDNLRSNNTNLDGWAEVNDKHFVLKSTGLRIKVKPESPASRGDSMGITITNGVVAYIEQIVLSYQTGVKLLVEGPPGTGKSAVLEMFSRYIGIPYIRFVCGKDTVLDDLVGQSIPTIVDSEFKLLFVEGPLTTAISQKAIICLDEFNNLSVNTMEQLLKFFKEETYVLPNGVTINTQDASIYALQNEVSMGSFRVRLPSSIVSCLTKTKCVSNIDEDLLKGFNNFQNVIRKGLHEDHVMGLLKAFKVLSLHCKRGDIGVTSYQGKVELDLCVIEHLVQLLSVLIDSSQLESSYIRSLVAFDTIITSRFSNPDDISKVKEVLSLYMPGPPQMDKMESLFQDNLIALKIFGMTQIGNHSYVSHRNSKMAIGSSKFRNYVAMKSHSAVLEKICLIIQAHLTPVLYGPPTAGITFMLNHVGYLFNQEVVTVTLSPYIDMSSLTGCLRIINQGKVIESIRSCITSVQKDLIKKLRDCFGILPMERSHQIRCVCEVGQLQQHQIEQVEEHVNSWENIKNSELNAIIEDLKGLRESLLLEETAQQGGTAIRYLEGPIVNAVLNGHILLILVEEGTPDTTVDSLNSLFEKNRTFTSNGRVLSYESGIHPLFRPIFAITTGSSQVQLSPAMQDRTNPVLIPSIDSDQDTFTEILECSMYSIQGRTSIVKSLMTLNQKSSEKRPSLALLSCCKHITMQSCKIRNPKLEQILVESFLHLFVTPLQIEDRKEKMTKLVKKEVMEICKTLHTPDRSLHLTLDEVKDYTSEGEKMVENAKISLLHSIATCILENLMFPMEQ